jgi:hypothetical protein
MSSDIKSILERMSALENKLTPATVKHGLNAQQRDVPQLPALFKPKSIRALGAKTDPTHPMKNYAVGGAAESRHTAANALEEAMQEVEEDMLSKVKKDLTKYLDKLEKKVKVDRALKDKAISAVEKGQAEEDLDEDDYELTDPGTVHGVEDNIDVKLANPQQPIDNMATAESAPVKTYAMENGTTLECWGNEKNGFELRSNNKTMPSKFRKLDHADMAVRLFQKRKAMKQQAQRQSNQDYVDER